MNTIEFFFKGFIEEVIMFQKHDYLTVVFNLKNLDTRTSG